MTRKALSLGIMGAIAAISMAVAPTAAEAQYRDGYHGRPAPGGYHRGGYGYDRGPYGRPGYGRGPYGYHRRCHGGTSGAIIGAIAGGLLGNAVAGYGNRAAGTIIGGGAGALAGNAIGRDC
jgi:hypothetical protein